jgi:superfamily II DNA or RNA helicase
MSRAHSIALNAMLNVEGIESACIIGETPFSERANIMEQFRNKKITAIVNFDILTTGVDIPGMNGILVLRKFNERHTAIQVLGRALRGTKNGGNEKNTVIFINEIYKQNINDLYNY